MSRAKRIISSALAVCLLCLSVSGCAKNGSSSPLEQTDGTKEYLKILPSNFTDGYIVCTNKMDLEIEKGSTTTPAFSFNVLSKEPLSDGDVSVNIDTDIPYDVIYNETTEQKGKFEEYICLQYNKANAENIDNSVIDSEYASLSDKQFPQFYNNQYTVQFDINAINGGEEINEIEVIIGDFSVKEDIGTISFINYRSQKENVGDFDLSFNSAGIAGVNIAGYAGGIISVPPQDAAVNNDVIIKDIYLLNESDTLSVNKVDIDLVSDDTRINQEWKKGEDFEIQKGTKATFNFETKDTKFKKNLNYAVNLYIIVEYEADGEMYVTSNQVLCETRYDSQLLYAMYKDNIDFKSYFEVNPIS